MLCLTWIPIWGQQGVLSTMHHCSNNTRMWVKSGRVERCRGTTLVTIAAVFQVAACICLFALDKHEAIPVDTHVWQLAVRYYTPHLKGTYMPAYPCSGFCMVLLQTWQKPKGNLLQERCGAPT